MRFELILVVLFRAIFGLVLAIVFSLIAWIAFRTTFPQFGFNSFTFALAPGIVIGGGAGLGALIAWFNTESPRPIAALAGALTFAAALAIFFVSFQIAQNNAEQIWVSRLGYVQLVNTAGFLYTTIGIVALGANIMAGGFYTFRALVRGEA